MTNETGSLSLSELLARYVAEEASAHAAGETFNEQRGDIELHDAGVQPVVDVRKAWEEAQFALHIAGTTPARVPTFTDWPALLAAPESYLALPLAAANSPQLVRNLQPLLLGTLTPKTPGLARPVPHAALRNWVELHAAQAPTQRLLAVGLLRLAQQYGEAERLLGNTAAPGWENAWKNERGALEWEQGHRAEAVALWAQLPKYLPAQFNRGMAALFQGNKPQAKQELTAIMTELPEASAWHHLARLYLTLADA